MSRCYYCNGPATSGERRWVVTSTGNWMSFGKRGGVRVGAGQRKSLRTLCHGCAWRHDRGVLVLLAIIAAVGLGLWVAGEVDPAFRAQLPTDQIERAKGLQ